jgi:hypothetical protein
MELQVYFNVDYEEKEKAKKLGFKFDWEIKCWYYIYKDIEEFKNSKYHFPPQFDMNEHRINERIRRRRIKDLLEYMKSKNLKSI